MSAYPEIYVILSVKDRSVKQLMSLDNLKKDHQTQMRPLLSFEEYVRQVDIEDKNFDLEKLNGTHFVYGYVDSLFQSPSSPYDFLYPSNVEADEKMRVQVIWRQ